MKPVYIVYFVMGLLAALFVYSQFIDPPGEPVNASPPITDSLLVNTYPKLYEDIYNREAHQLDPYLNHDSLSIRKQAWRALASTPVDSIGRYMDLALEMESDTHEPWLALSMHTLSTDQLRLLEKHWLDKPEKRSGISLVLGQAGDRSSLNFLLQNMEQAADSSYEFDYALAIGRLLVRFAVGEEVHQKIIERAFLNGESRIVRAYLYGFYRGDQQSMTRDTKNLLYGLWKEFGLGNSEMVDQYVVRLLSEEVFYEVTLFQNSEDDLDIHIQLAIELAQAVRSVEMTRRNVLATRILLTHENPHVVEQTLQALDGKLEQGEVESLKEFIATELVADSTTHPYVWLQALETSLKADGIYAELEKHENRLQEISEAYPYYLSHVHAVWQIMNRPQEYLDKVQQTLSAGDPFRSLQAVNALGSYWTSLPEEKRTEKVIERFRELVFMALELQDRGVAYGVVGLLTDDILFSQDDFRRINRALTSFRLPEDIEVYHRFGNLYKQKYENQATPVIDSLAALGYPPLNRSLMQSGWEQVPEPEEITTEFRQPNWDRIWELGKNPTWVLQTEKGFIRVEMNTLSAPATVSAIDSLTRANAYDGVPFHRVIPNFVIQGGDIERRDGFGGPEFTIPTESSEHSFRRGAAGIASAGNDTEGSQYFFMHQWKPHLDGGYTLFGHVTDGMDVVDRILPGDKVLYAYWE